MSMKPVLAGFLALSLGACVTTGPSEVTPTASEQLPSSSELSREFWSAAVDCVIVAPIIGIPPGERARLIETSVARHAFQRIGRVIGPNEREGAARRLAVDLLDVEGGRVLARHFRCNHVIETQVEVVAEAYSVTWMERTLDLTLTLTRIGGDTVLWRSQAVRRAGDGGIPMSVLGLADAMFRAGRAQADEEAWPRLVEDVVRGAFASLPDVRGAAAGAPGSRSYPQRRLL
jgi:hypothetical protein